MTAARGMDYAFLPVGRKAATTEMIQVTTKITMVQIAAVCMCV